LETVQHFFSEITNKAKGEGTGKRGKENGNKWDGIINPTDGAKR